MRWWFALMGVGAGACTFTPRELSTDQADAGPNMGGPDARMGVIDAGGHDCTPMDLELLANGGFDDTPSSWVEDAAPPKPQIIYTAKQLQTAGINGISPQAGTRLAWMGGVLLSEEGLSEGVMVPADVMGIHLQGYHLIATQEDNSTSTIFDTVTFELDSQAQQINEIVTFSNLDASNSWVAFDMPLTGVTGFAGQTMILKASASLDAVENTNFFLDSLRLTARVCR